MGRFELVEILYNLQHLLHEYLHGLGEGACVSKRFCFPAPAKAVYSATQKQFPLAGTSDRLERLEAACIQAKAAITKANTRARRSAAKLDRLSKAEAAAEAAAQRRAAQASAARAASPQPKEIQPRSGDQVTAALHEKRLEPARSTVRNSLCTATNDERDRRKSDDVVMEDTARNMRQGSDGHGDLSISKLFDIVEESQATPVTRSRKQHID